MQAPSSSRQLILMGGHGACPLHAAPAIRHPTHPLIFTHFLLQNAYFIPTQFKGIDFSDFDGVFMILSYCLDVRHVPLHILIFNFMFSYLNCIPWL
jgi:hypothetical protein